VDWDELRAAVMADPPADGDLVYIARQGTGYSWAVVTDAADALSAAVTPAEAWIYYAGPWPVADPDRQGPFFDDLRAELESMLGGGDRCRWPLDEPWPHGH
jgi:hypothetical protein